MKYIITLLLINSSANASAQQEVMKRIAKVMSLDLEKFVPPGYDTLATATGDLNKDGFKDVVMVLKSKLEEKSYDAIDVDTIPPRLLIVLSKSGNNKEKDAYFVSAISDKAILCKSCGGVFGDPFEGIEITNGIIKLYHYGGSAWRWSNTDKFRFKEGKYYHIGSTRSSYWNVKRCDKLGDFAGTEFEDINYLTGQFEKKKISENCKLLMHKKGKQKILPLVDLQKFSLQN